jgi:hypothetical protein
MERILVGESDFEQLEVFSSEKSVLKIRKGMLDLASLSRVYYRIVIDKKI